MAKMTHLNSLGEAHMVDISSKIDTARSAIAEAKVELTDAVVVAVNDDNLPKGDLFATCLLYTFRAHETPEHLVCRLLLEKKKTKFNDFLILS